MIYLSLICIISANAERVIVSETMVKEKEIISKLKKNLRDLFESTNFIKVKEIKAEVKGLFPELQVKPDLIAEVQTRIKESIFLFLKLSQQDNPVIPEWQQAS